MDAADEEAMLIVSDRYGSVVKVERVRREELSLT